METGNSGIIGYQETRSNINAMKEYYRKEYKKIVDKERKVDSNLFHNRWKIRLGSFAARVGMVFNPNKSVRMFTRIGTRAFSFLSQKILLWKNKRDKIKFKKQKEQLTADFINADGEFKEFYAINNTTIEEDYDEIIETKGMVR